MTDEPREESFQNGSPRPARRRWLVLTAVVCTVCFVGWLVFPKFFRARARGQSSCKSNLKKLGTAMEMYSTDHSGKYPASMAQLTPNYLKTIPDCPQNGPGAYQMWTGANAPGNPGNKEYYYAHCIKGHPKINVPPGYPAYNGVVGLIERSPPP